MPPSTASLLQCAAEAAGAQQYPRGALYLVATPIGNLADLTLRAIHVLALADAVACEDTRVTGGLLQHLGLAKPLLAVHAHREHEGAAAVLARLAGGERVAYASDAGTPAISDPGAVLVAAAAARGFPVIPVPGPSGPAAALSVAGDTGGTGYAFVGFLPARGEERRRALAEIAERPTTQVLFEAPHRIESLVDALAAAAPQRRLTICRELTKQFETVVTLPAGDAPDWLRADSNRSRGEFVLVLHARPPVPAAGRIDAAADRALTVLLAELPLRQAVGLAAAITGAPRNALYQRALERSR